MRDFEAHEFAAVKPMQLRQECVGLKRYSMRNQPCAPPQQRPKAIEHRKIKPSADEDGLRRLEVAQHSGRGPLDDRNPVGEAERRGILADIFGAILASFDRDRTSSAQRPFDGDRAGSRADVPQTFAWPWRKRRERQCAHLPPGDLAIMHEKRIRMARAARQPAKTLRFQCDGQEVRGWIGVVAVRAMLRDGFAFPSKRSKGPELRMAPPLGRQPFGESDTSFAVAQETNDPLTVS